MSELIEQVEKETAQVELPSILVALLKGVIYKETDPKLWTALMRYQSRVRDYVATIWLELILDEAEGYAFLRSAQVTGGTGNIQSSEMGEEQDLESAPRLVARRQLSFPVSLLIALLRKRLAEFDARGGDTRLVLSRDEIVELLKVFLPSGTNESKLVNQIETHINKIIDLGFLRKLKPQYPGDLSYEVRRILKAFVDAQWLSDFDLLLAQYQNKLLEGNDKSGDGDND